MTIPGEKVVCTRCGAVNRVAEERPLDAARCGKCGEALFFDHPREISAGMLTTLRTRDGRPFILDVWAPWCGPCRMMAPAYAEAARRLAGSVRFLKLNSEEHPQASIDLGVRGIPALFLFQGGRVTDQRMGAQSADLIEGFARQALR